MRIPLFYTWCLPLVLLCAVPSMAENPDANRNMANTSGESPFHDAHQAYHFAVKGFGMSDSIVYNGWSGWRAGLDNAVCDMLTSELSSFGWNLVERSRLADTLSEQDLSKSGRVDEASSIDTGKLKGADFLILGTITEWGIKDTGLGAAGKALGGLFGGHGQSAQYNETDARVKIDYRIVNAKTGEIIGRSTGTAQGDEKNRSVSLRSNWWSGIDFNQSEWLSSQIGKATRQAVHQMAQQLNTLTPKTGWPKQARALIHGSVVAVSSPTEIIIDQGESQGVHEHDVFDLFSVTKIRNSAGKVVFEKKVKIGEASVDEVQKDGAVLHVLNLNAGAKLVEGSGVASHAEVQ